MKKTSAKLPFILMAAAILSSALVSCKGKSEKTAKEEETETIYAVNADIVQAGNLDDYLEFGGDVSSVSAVDVYPDAAGKISRIRVSVGDLVKKDQIIAYVDPSRPGMNYSENPVKAPISGRVTSFPPTIGTMVSQSYSIAKISDTDELQIKVNVAERFISRIRENQTAIVSFDAYPGVEFKARVFEVSPVLDTTSRTMLAKLKVEPADSRIKAGMYARVKLITDTIEGAVVIPNDAIVYRDGKPYVFTAKSESAESSVNMVSVKEGLSVDNKTEIQEGLKEGDVIIVKGQSLLSDGSKVKILSISGKAVESKTENKD
ncbi:MULTISPECIES: efflux RND transporter periplasmic adaptor subunit [Treponema]|uniref:Efflux transporter, RND family, MFP subunit n=1 Tax=Treponema succinifaciens (strain ATCC 33096 / DSM 2489 / 6091) TaxID=869209 RepID=F2NRT9_TRES6|nr:efflux RND transporter periplasmic adaptor subunit [Treponema succinifaciens]AEB14175.1 efflux transporter, RND family, MFP subunit [Treponema succinifaciens DSM 2489]MCI6912190.1 efflux RND transporter periplasmic adaptor subunit [Treponema succinifaciens]MEE0351989.1 efflux RND transporter periplasmic adaptor subunit [Treponema sp.]UKI54515.1 MAG: efflux RND transporter periplasmic adaptor subunit [Treponema succinifaciens]